MARRSTPLYEFMITRGRQAPREEHPAPSDEQEAIVAPAALRLGAGRTIRVPVGFVFLAGAGCILLLIGAYVAGHSSGEQAAEARLEERFLGSTDLLSPAGRADDPLAAANAQGSGSGSGGLVPPSLGRIEEQVPEAAGSGLGPIEFDPRSDQGLHYFVLATTKKEGAVRLAEFCRANGLAAYVIDSNNARFRRVIALPGLRSRSSPAVSEMRDRIRSIGQTWKDIHPGESDLSDAYMIQ